MEKNDLKPIFQSMSTNILHSVLTLTIYMDGGSTTIRIQLFLMEHYLPATWPIITMLRSFIVETISK